VNSQRDFLSPCKLHGVSQAVQQNLSESNEGSDARIGGVMSKKQVETSAA